MRSLQYYCKLCLKWADDLNSLEIALSFCVLIWMTIFMFLLCEPGSRMTSQFVAFSDEIDKLDWYLLSIKLRQMYVLFLLDTQNPMKVLSYANITFERETFKKVI